MKTDPRKKSDNLLLHTMKRFNKDLDWLKLNHPEAYRRLLKAGKISTGKTLHK